MEILSMTQIAVGLAAVLIALGFAIPPHGRRGPRRRIRGL